MKQFFIYCLVGASATVLDFSTFGLLRYFDLNVIVRQWLSSLVGGTYNFFWHHYVVFPGHGQKPGRTYAQSMIATITVIIISGPLLAQLEKIFINIWAAKVALVGITILANFAIRKWYIFLPTSANQ